MACKHTLNLSSTMFRTKPLLRTSPLLSLGKCHVSTTSKLSRKETLRQIRAKQWYAHLYTEFHTMNGHTSPAFKILLTDIATRAGYTVNENDEVAGFRCDCTENDPMILKEEAEQRRRVVKSAEDLVNEDDDVVRRTRRNWFEESEDEDGDDGNATDDEDEDGTENRLDRYFDAMEKNANAVLERVRVLKGEKKEEEVNKPEKKHPKSFNEAFLEQMRVVKVEKKKEDGDRPEEKYKRILIESIWRDPDDEIICSEEVDKFGDMGWGGIMA